MPRIPKWLADPMLKVFSSHVHQCKVVRTEHFHDRLKRVRFQCNGLKNEKWWPGVEVEFRVSDTEFRHYTACDWNADDGYVDVLVYLHGQGPGSKFMADLSVGDAVQLLGPGGRFLLDFACQEYVLLGDETAMGLFLAFQHCMLPRTLFTGAIECEDEGFPKSVGLDLKGVKRLPDENGKSLLKWMESTPLSTSNCQYFIAGNAATNRLLREKLRSIGVAPAMIRVKPYWAKGKEGL